MKKELLTIAVLFLFMPAFASADHHPVPFCGDGIVEEGETCELDTGVTTQCWKEGAKIGVGNHYQLGELCLGYDNQTRKSTGESGVCLANSNCWIGGDELQGTKSRIVVIDKTSGLEEYIQIYIYDPGRSQLRGYQTDAYVKEIIEGPDHYLANFCNTRAPCVHNNDKGSSLIGDRNGKWNGFATRSQPGVIVSVTNFKDWFETEPSESEKKDWFQTRTEEKPYISYFGIKQPGKYVLGIIDARGHRVESEEFIVCPNEFCETTEVAGSVSDGHGFFVPDLEVTLSQETAELKDLVFTTYTDENGYYFFDELIDEEKPIRLTFTFKGEPDENDKDRYEIRDLKAKDGSIFNTSDRPVSATTIDIDIDDVPEIFDFVKNLDLIESANINDKEQLDDFARVHMLVASALWFFEDALDTVLHEPNMLRVYGNPRRSTSYYSGYNHAFYLAADDVLWDDYDEPDNGVWHEISHALHYSAQTGGKNKFPTDRHGYGHYNHLGYANPGTADSYTEGFAMFMSQVIQNELEFKDHADDEPWIYRYGYSSSFHMDDNIKVWASMGNDEDVSVSTLLWDLYDSPSMYGGRDDDNVSLSIEQIWKVLNDPEVRDVKDIFDGFSKIVPLLDLEKIFISHGVFYDKNGNQKHDRGEEVGVARYGLSFLTEWDFEKDGGKVYDVNAIVGRWLLGGSGAKSAPAGAGSSVPRWGSADIDGDGDISGMTLTEDDFFYTSGVVDKDSDGDFGPLTDMDGDGKAEMTEEPFWVMPYDLRRSFQENRQEQLELTIMDENGEVVPQTYLTMTYKYEDEFSYRDYETRALVPGSGRLSIWVGEGATLTIQAEAGKNESESKTITYLEFVNRLVPNSDQGSLALQIPASNVDIASAISAEQAAASESDKRPDNTKRQKSNGDSDSKGFVIPFIILIIVLAVGSYIYKTKRRKSNN